MQQDDIVLVMTSAPDLLLAKRIAHLVIEEGLAACINLGTPVLSVYSWQGDVEAAEEIPMTFKTTWFRQADLIARIQALHPYDVPELIVVPVIAGHAPYLNWIRELTRAPTQC
jgi:periplasmic divalent cation tolerance protein